MIIGSRTATPVHLGTRTTASSSEPVEGVPSIQTFCSKGCTQCLEVPEHERMKRQKGLHNIAALVRKPRSDQQQVNLDEGKTLSGTSYQTLAMHCISVCKHGNTVQPGGNWRHRPTKLTLQGAGQHRHASVEGYPALQIVDKKDMGWAQSEQEHMENYNNVHDAAATKRELRPNGVQ